MKKKIFLIFAGVLAAAVVLGGCGKKKAAGDGSSAGAEDVQITAKEMLASTKYDVEDYVTLNDYKNIAVTLSKDYEVSEDNIRQYADMSLETFPNYVKTDKKTVENGDVVNIDYEGKKDGEAFDGGTADGQHLEIGSGSFIEGFEEGLIGKNVGDTVDLNLTFPEDYSNTDLAGQAVVFTVKINSIEEKQTMTYDNITDEYISSNFGSGGISTVDDFKSQIRSIIEQNYQSALNTAVLDVLTNECKVNLPEGLIDERMETYIDKINKQLAEQDQTFEDAVGVTEEEYRQQIREDLEKEVTQELILEAIVQKEDISISQNEYESFIQNYMSAYGFADEASFYEQYGEKAYVRLSYAENKALESVRDSAKVTFADEAEDDSADTAQEQK